MNDYAESESMLKGPVAYPLLLECDLHGRVLWMSDRARQVMRYPERLSYAMIRRKPLPHAADEMKIGPLRMWRVWEARDRVLIGARMEAEPQETEDLLALQRRLTGHFLQLIESERRLFA